MDPNSFPQRLGNGMVILAWIIVLGLATFYFDRYLDKQHNPNQQVATTQSGKTREVILERNRAGHYVATARINDQAVVAMLDTGATHISIPEHIAQQLQLDRGPSFQVSTANGDITVYATILDKVQLGKISLDRVRANINPYMHQNEILLGMSFLKHIEFTQRGNQLTLKQYD